MNGMAGPLWYDGSSRPLEVRLKAALAHYQNTYKKAALVCLVNPKDAQGQDLDALSKSCGVTIRAVRQVIVSHFWMGEETAMTEKVNA